MKIPNLRPAASLGLGEGLGVWERTKPAGRFGWGDGEPGALRGGGVTDPQPPSNRTKGFRLPGPWGVGKT